VQEAVSECLEVTGDWPAATRCPRARQTLIDVGGTPHGAGRTGSATWVA